MKQGIIAVVAALTLLYPALIVTETVLVMGRFGARHLAWGVAATALLVIWASRCGRRGFRLALLVAAIMALWIAMYQAADSGYRVWQASPDAPGEAYSDTGPIFFLLLGWLPGWGISYLLLLLCRRMAPCPPVQPPALPSDTR